jgi:hypothetical protein
MDLAPPHLPAARVARAPVVDGRLDDEAWKAAPPSDAFTQQYPFDRQPPSERTVLRVLYDDEALYFGVECEQVHTPIVERLTRRDHDSESEWVSVYLDSRNDGKHAFIFAANVSGVMADGQILNQSVYSFEWDENWEARTARTATGWSAEFRIPLRVLRFDRGLPIQSWGMQVIRFIAQRQEQDLWSYYPRDVAAPVPYFGRLDELRDLRGGGPLELRPFVLGFGRRRQTVAEMLASGYDGGASAGLDLKLHLGPDLTLDGAINPDFAQVEADQVILNLTNYEIFLPEKRPLFLEGAEAFAFPIPIFYSRRIGTAPLPPSLPTATEAPLMRQLVDVPGPATIYGAGKLVGRLTPEWSIGALAAVTGRNEVLVDDPATRARVSELTAPLTAFSVLRLRRELGSTGHLGVIGTGATAFERDGGYPLAAPGSPNQLCPGGETTPTGSRCFHDAYVGGADAVVRSESGNYVASGAFVQSWIRGGPPRTLPDGTVVGPGAYAPGGWLRLAKEGGKHILLSAEYSGAGRYLDYNDVGFMQRQAFHELKTSAGYRTLDAGARTIDTQTSIDVDVRRNLDGVDLGQLYDLQTRIKLRNFWVLSAAAEAMPDHFDDREIGDGAALERTRWGGLRLEIDSDPRGALVATLAEHTQVIAGGAYAASAQATVVVHALPQLELELSPQVTWADGEWRFGWNATGVPADSYLFGRLAARSAGVILRASYTFTPRLSLQAYAQAFLASGHYTDLRELPRPAAPRGTLITSGAIASMPAPSVPPPSPDFEEAALNANIVLRWEYLLGSTLYFVYSRSQVPAVGTFADPGHLDLRALGNRASADVVLLKLSYWWSS